MKMKLISLLALVAVACGTPPDYDTSHRPGTSSQVTPPGLRTVLVDGVSITGDGRTTSLVASTAGVQMLGTGADGSLNFDGSTAVLGITPVSSKYTLTRSIWPSSITIGAGVTVYENGWLIVCSGTTTFTNSSTSIISGNGNDAVAQTGGAISWSSASQYLGGGGSGGNGGAGNGSNPGNAGTNDGVVRGFATSSIAATTFNNAGTAGGVGQGGTGGASLTGLVSGAQVTRTLMSALHGDVNDWALLLEGRGLGTATPWDGGTGGASGAGDNVAGKQGGGGGGGAGTVIFRSKKCTGGGVVSAKGGAGASGVAGGTTGGGGGGGGGIVIVVCGGTMPTIDVSGGAAGGTGGGGKAGGAGGAGLSFSLQLN